MNRTLLLLLGLALLPAAGGAQSPVSWDPQGLQMERAQLESLQVELAQVATSTAYSARLRDEARRDAELIRERLTLGDFRTGDQVTLFVDNEPLLTGDFPVEGGPRINLPGLGAISLEGVLRSELEGHLTRELARFIQNPVVRAQSRFRIAVQGAVGTPGFHTAPGDMLFSELIMFAGGPATSANLEDLRVERLGTRIWEGEELRVALAEGRTLVQMNLRGGTR